MLAVLSGLAFAEAPVPGVFPLPSASRAGLEGIWLRTSGPVTDGWIVDAAGARWLRTDHAGGVKATPVTLTPGGPCQLEVTTPNRGPVPFTFASDASGVWLGGPLSGRMSGEVVVLCGFHTVTVVDATSCWQHHQTPDKTDAGWTFRPWTVHHCDFRVVSSTTEAVSLSGLSPLTFVRRGDLLFDAPPAGGPLAPTTEADLRATLSGLR